jgi:hypothetical protein
VGDVESVTFAEKAKLPAVVGEPVIVPPEPKVRPGGRDPAARLQV